MFADISEKMPSQKLKHAPLQEVIFELFWKLPTNEQGFAHDPGFELAQGVFASKIQPDFPVHKRLAAEFPLFFFRRPVHQFWKDELTWPVVQLGQGILAVNDTEANYVWTNNFQANIKKAVKALQHSYAGKFHLEIERARLQYVDTVEFDPRKEIATSFIARNMNTVLKNDYKLAGKPVDVHIAQTFNLKDNSTLQLSIQNGIKNQTGNPAIIWTTITEKSVGLNFKNLFAWLEFAHETTSNTFVNMLNPDFYASFDR